MFSLCSQPTPLAPGAIYFTYDRNDSITNLLDSQFRSDYSIFMMIDSVNNKFYCKYFSNKDMYQYYVNDSAIKGIRYNINNEFLFSENFDNTVKKGAKIWLYLLNNRTSQFMMIETSNNLENFSFIDEHPNVFLYIHNFKFTPGRFKLNSSFIIYMHNLTKY